MMSRCLSSVVRVAVVSVESLVTPQPSAADELATGEVVVRFQPGRTAGAALLASRAGAPRIRSLQLERAELWAVLGETGTGTSADIASGIAWAAANRADILLPQPRRPVEPRDAAPAVLSYDPDTGGGHARARMPDRR